MKLSRATICLDCDFIFDQTIPACPQCGSRSAWPLARWLNGLPPPALNYRVIKITNPLNKGMKINVRP